MESTHIHPRHRDPGVSGQWPSFDTATAVRGSLGMGEPRAAAAFRARLRASLTVYVRQLAADGVPVERMLVTVKAAVRDALPARGDPDQASALVADVVRWSIEAYFDGT